MIRLDGYKILIPAGYFSYNPTYYNRELTILPSGEIKAERFIFKGDVIKGLKSIVITDSGAIIEGSAKLLKERYSEGINVDTVNLLFSNIQSTGVIEFSEGVETVATVLRADITYNLTVSDPEQYLDALQSAFSTVNKRVYKGSVVFYKRTKSNPIYLTFYDKYFELQKTKESEFMEQFKNVLRSELRLINQGQLRKALSITDLTLFSVLTSERKPNYEIFNKIVKEPKPMPATTKQLKDFALYQLCRVDFDGNLRHFRLYLQSAFKLSSKQASRIIRDMQNAVHSLTLPERSEKVGEIRNLLNQ